ANSERIRAAPSRIEYSVWLCRWTKSPSLNRNPSGQGKDGNYTPVIWVSLFITPIRSSFKDGKSAAPEERAGPIASPPAQPQPATLDFVQTARPVQLKVADVRCPRK